MGPVSIRVYTLEVQGVTFAISLTELPKPLAGVNQIDQSLDGMSAGAAQASGGKVVSQRRIRYAGFPGTEFDIEMPGGKGSMRTRGCVVKQRIYAVGVGPKDKLTSQDLEKFFDSFKVDVPPDEEPAPPIPGMPVQPAGAPGAQALAALATHCAMCHTGPKSKGRPQVVIFNGPGVVNANAPKELMAEAINSGKMPPPNRPRPSAQDLAALKAWLGGGK
jgi:hypothetical protein